MNEMQWKIGEIKYGKGIGYKNNDRRIWCSCEGCGKERWVKFWKGIPSNKLCRSCAQIGKALGEKHYRWKGGKIKLSSGYIEVRVYPNDFYYLMTCPKRRYVLEHRLIMAKSLGRNLHSWEIVHHKNGVRDDNRRENLELSSNGSHALLHNKGYKDGYSKGYKDGLKQAMMEAMMEAINEKR